MNKSIYIAVYFRTQTKDIQIKMCFISIFKCLQLLLLTYLVTVTVILLLTGTIGNVNNGNILTDRTTNRKYLEKNAMNYNNNNCRFIYAGYMILLLQM